ncbi:MAG: 3-isopropylmalate dehydratase large subunit [Candidatus Bathyarchaeota archaeon]|nr:homoaconitase large subunit [Candidatus Bathyarchaeum tardum]WGM89899.1 MAG: homoaconitase large subunit [Candidatus Bathyarchaeum tardum]WNZ29940.1 MAG: 3-isopropylmalate dehydratase large subunit [Candidatus Bathyarchaeota archaeon]
MNIIEKILARASNKNEVVPGEIVEANIDVAMTHDLTGPLAIQSFKEIGAKKVWNTDKIVVILDHLVPASSVISAGLHNTVRDFVNEQGIKNFYDVGRGGVCHQVMPEKGHVRPGEVIVGSDSHTCTYGAFGAFATGIGSTEMAAVFTTGKLWFRVPEVIKVDVTGNFQNLVSAKDLTLKVVGEIGADGAIYKGLEFTGQTIRDLTIDGRMVLSNMAVEMGAKAGLIEPDQKTMDYVNARTEMPFTPQKSDADATYEKVVDIDVNNLEPQVAVPHSVDNVKPVSEVEGTELNQGFIGSCTNGRLEDLREAAKILKGKQIAKTIRLIVIPASQEIYLNAVQEGLVKTFMESGATVANPNCGPCLGGHMGIMTDGEACISTSNRNFIGRMGSTKSYVYLASPATVAASAITGKITDPTK